jgi:hypothetical protein
MTEFLPEEQQLLDEAVERLKKSRQTFLERTALQKAWKSGYMLSLQYDDRFVKAQPRNGSYDPHYRLREHILANQRLFNDLVEGNWDGIDLDARLAALDREEGGHHVFYPHDGRFLDRQGRWEPAVETNITLTSIQKSELDTFLPGLMQSWSSQGYKPWTLRHFLEELKQVGWPGAALPNAILVIRSWLLSTEQIRRVGQDFWLPTDRLPTPIKHTRLQVLPIRLMRSEDMQALDKQFIHVSRESPYNNYKPFVPQSADPVIVSGEVASMSAHWTTTLLTINLQEGFLSVPAGSRAVYPSVAPGEGLQVLLDAVWHEDGEHFDLWLDRQQHRLYGPGLLSKIEWDRVPGDKLRIVWAPDVLTIYLAGHDEQVQQQEARHIDPRALKELRGGLGEAYRDSIQRILAMTPEGLTDQEIWHVISERLKHTVNRRTVLSLLYSSGFVKRDQRWFAAPDNAASRRSLRTALIATLQPQREDLYEQPPSLSEHIHQQTLAIMRRLEEIDRLL